MRTASLELLEPPREVAISAHRGDLTVAPPLPSMSLLEAPRLIVPA